MVGAVDELPRADGHVAAEEPGLAIEIDDELPIGDARNAGGCEDDAIDVGEEDGPAEGPSGPVRSTAEGREEIVEGLWTSRWTAASSPAGATISCTEMRTR